MLSVVTPVLNAGPTLERSLAALASDVDEIVVVDGGSEDGSRDAAARTGAVVCASARGRGVQMRHGAERARGDWLLFLHADTRLDAGWRRSAEAFMTDSAAQTQAAYFKLAFDDGSWAARRTAAVANWRAQTLGLPYGDQGLLIPAAFYQAVGGYNPIPLMEDVDMVRRIGRRRLRCLDATAVTSADKYRSAGWLRRSSRNLFCLSLYFLGVDPARIQRVYG